MTSNAGLTYFTRIWRVRCSTTVSLQTGFDHLKGYDKAVPYLFILSAEILSNKIRQDFDVKGIKVFENEIKLSQFADDTTLFNADLVSLERALEIVNEFGKLAGLFLNVKKTKAI